MQLSSKGRYAVMAMADIASAGEDAVVGLAAISDRQHISQTYLEQLFAKLRRAGLVESVRGPGGGYRLAHPPSGISVAEVMAAVDEPVKMTRCGDDQEDGCVVGHRCLTHDLWSSLGDHIVGFLDRVSLENVIENAQAKASLRAALSVVADDVADTQSQLEARR